MFSVQAARLGIQVNTHHQWILEKKVNKQKIADESKVFLEYYDTKKTVRANEGRSGLVLFTCQFVSRIIQQFLLRFPFLQKSSFFYF